MDEVWRRHWRWVSPAPLLSTGSAPAGCLGLCPLHFLKFPTIEAPHMISGQPALLSVHLHSKKVLRVFLCSAVISCISVCVHLLLPCDRPLQRWVCLWYLFIHTDKNSLSLLFLCRKVPAFSDSPHVSYPPVPWSFSWPFARLTPACPCLSCTGKHRIRHKTPVLSSGERSSPSICCWCSA